LLSAPSPAGQPSRPPAPWHCAFGIRRALPDFFQFAWIIADVLFTLDSLVIETYRELMGVFLGLAVAVAAVRLAWLRARKHKPAATRKAIALPLATAAPVTAARMLEADAEQFDRLAKMISTVSQRAAHVSATQSQAALKLDTVEMAMHRMLSDVDGLVNLPKHMSLPAPAAIISAAAPALRATRAA
jgi:hypothetical protein